MAIQNRVFMMRIGNHWPRPGAPPVAVLAGVLAGCAGSPSGPPPAAEPYAWLEILEPLQIPADSAHVDLQDGGPAGGVDRTRLYCTLEVDTVSERPQTVAAQRLAVRGVQRRILADEQANIPAFQAWTFSCSGDRYYRVRIDLHGERAPRVRNLTCTEWYMSCDLGEYATLERIEQTVGPTIRWRAPEPGRRESPPGDYR